MAKVFGKWTLVVFMGLLLVISLMPACASDDNESDSETVDIIIGNLTDQTGASATAMNVIDKALNDAVEYYNEQGLVPDGARLKVISYDTQYEPSKDVSGYALLKNKGADLIMANVPHSPINLRYRVDEDQMVLFTSAANRDTVYPPGYVFVPTTLPEDNAYTLLKWIVENDPNFPTERQAKIGAAGWNTPYNTSLHDAMEEYALAHSDKYEWVGSYTIDIGFNWITEVEELKDCDYVMLPVLAVNFVKQYREAGYAATFLGTGAQAAFQGLITDARLWDEIDGSYFILPSGWWNDDNEIINLTKELLYQKHPNSADDIMRKGASYISIDGIYQMLDIIVDALETVGPEDFNSQALYEAAQSYSQNIDGVTRASFSKTKRSSIDHLAIYEVNGAEKDMFQVHNELYPVVRSVND